MTTQQAAVRAANLSRQGYSKSKIGKMLAKEGYVSFRTGKPVSSGGVAAMIYKIRDGHTFTNRRVVKFANTAATSMNKRPVGRPMKNAGHNSFYKNPAYTGMQTSTADPSMPTKFVSMPTVSVATNQVITRWDIAKLIEMSNDFQAATKRALLELIVDASVK